MNDGERTSAEREIARLTNGAVWALIEQSERTADEDQTMFRLAHTSAYHWGRVGGPQEWTRAEWLVSRVCVLIGRMDDARWYADRALALCLQHAIDGFDLAYGHEAVARAAAGSGDAATARSERAEAIAAAESITDPEDRQIFDADLASAPWFGIE